MSNNILLKGFNFCVSKFKCFPTLTFPPAATSDQPSGDAHVSSKSTTFSEDSLSSSSGYNSDDDYIPDFASAFASHRFFVSSPGNTNSILELPAVVAGGVAVLTYSPDPYSDFRKSMVEMIESKDIDGMNWGFLHELLLCYLSLNPKHTHKFIIAAFADVIVSLSLPEAAGKVISDRLQL